MNEEMSTKKSCNDRKYVLRNMQIDKTMCHSKYSCVSNLEKTMSFDISNTMRH